MRGILRILILCTLMGTLFAQNFRLFNRDVQVHGFLSQGFAYTNQNNWLTMKTSDGSFAYTDFGVNVATQVTDKFRIGVMRTGSS